MSSRATLSDVAKACGVSSQTVSRALNDSPLVRPETRAKVMAAVETVGYEPNLAARALAAGGSRAVGILLTTRLTHGMSTTFTALVGTLREHSRPFVLDTAIENDEESLRAALARLRGYSVQATILLAQRAKSVAIASQQRHGDKLVSVIAGHPDSPESPIVTIDQALGARLATKHLIEQGYRNLLHVPGDLEWQDASERLSSYIAVCKEVGIDPAWMPANSWGAEAGAAVAEELIAGHLPDAVLAGNDDIAIGMCHTFLTHGVRIPDDIGIVGFDDIPQARWMTPSLTTVVQDFEALGRQAVEAAEALIAGEAPESCQLSPTLAVRHSSRRH